MVSGGGFPGKSVGTQLQKAFNAENAEGRREILCRD